MANGKRKDEIEIWKHGWKFNYLIGQLNYVASKYDEKFEVYVENKYYFSRLQKQKGDGIKVLNKKIDTELLIKLLKKGEAIIYIDCYYLQKVLHAPHFVIAVRQVKNGIEIADPFDGKIKRISIRVVDRAISSLRNHLKYSPVLITIPEDKH